MVNRKGVQKHGHTRVQAQHHSSIKWASSPGPGQLLFENVCSQNQGLGRAYGSWGVHNQIPWITPSLSHDTEISPSCPVFRWECSKYPQHLPLVTFRLYCNHHRGSLGLSFGEWRLAISLYPFLSSQASEHLSRGAWESIIALPWGKPLSPGSYSASEAALPEAAPSLPEPFSSLSNSKT